MKFTRFLAFTSNLYVTRFSNFEDFSHMVHTLLALKNLMRDASTYGEPQI